MKKNWQTLWLNLNWNQKYENKIRTIWGSANEKKKRTPQVQVKFSGSYSVFYLVFFNFNWYYYIKKYCHAMVAIAIKHMCALFWVKCIPFYFTGKNFFNEE